MSTVFKCGDVEIEYGSVYYLPGNVSAVDLPRLAKLIDHVQREALKRLPDPGHGYRPDRYENGGTVLVGRKCCNAPQEAHRPYRDEPPVTEIDP